MRPPGSRASGACLALLVTIALGAGCATTGGRLGGRVAATTRGRGLEATVIYLKGEATDRDLGGRTVVVEEGARGFAPALRAISTGTRVEFQNRDHVFHNAFSVSPAKPFDVGAIAPGEKRVVTFDEAGVIQVFCELHPKEAATLVVLPTPYFTRADAEGRFRLGHVPPGDYELVAWHPDLGEIHRDVRIPAKGTLRVDLSY